MNLETLFDDLEAQLACSANSRITSLQKLFEVRRLRLHFRGEEQFNLVAPILGDDFVAGFEDQSGNWMLAAHAQVARIDFDYAGDHELPKLRRQSSTLSDFLKSVPMPAAASLGMTDGRSQGAVLLEATAKWLFVQPASETVATAHALESLRFICLLESSDRGELQEWSAR